MRKESKIINYSNLYQVFTKLKKIKKTIVQCHGVFDLLHI